MATEYFVITPSNAVLGPFATIEQAQENIPDSHDVPMYSHVTDMKACGANLRHSVGIGDAYYSHVQTWVRDAGDDADETGYLIFKV